MKITKRLLNGDTVELSIYGNAVEITGQLNKLYNMNAVDLPVETVEPCTIVYVNRERYLWALHVWMIATMPEEVRQAHKGQAHGAVDWICKTAQDYFDSLPDETAPLHHFVNVPLHRIGSDEPDLAAINSIGMALGAKYKSTIFPE